jgi:hypothetical protein
MVVLRLLPSEVQALNGISLSDVYKLLCRVQYLEINAQGLEVGSLEAVPNRCALPARLPWDQLFVTKRNGTIRQPGPRILFFFCICILHLTSFDQEPSSILAGSSASSVYRVEQS